MRTFYIVAQVYEYAKYHQILELKWMIFKWIILNKAVIKDDVYISLLLKKLDWLYLEFKIFCSGRESKCFADGVTKMMYSVQFSRSVMSDSLRPHEPQHASPPCPSPTPGIHPNPCPSSWWYHPTISSSVIPFSSCLQSFQASGSFPMSQLFASAGQSIGASTTTSVPPMNTKGWSPLEWTGWISLQSKGLSRVFSNTTVQKHQFFGAQLSL